LAFPASRTDVLCGAAGIATHSQPTRHKQQENGPSKHDCSLTEILGYWDVKGKVRRRKALLEQATILQGHYSPGS
jgi:hypothetical protein